MKLILERKGGSMYCIRLAQDRDQCLAPVHMVISSEFHKVLRISSVTEQLIVLKNDWAPWSEFVNSM